MLNFCGIVVAILKMATARNFPFWKWRPVEIFRCWESIQVIIIYLHMKFRWNRTMLNLCSIVVAILKMVNRWNFSMSGINSGHHNLPTHEMSLKVGQCWIRAVLWSFWKWWPVKIFQCRESIRDILIYPHNKFWWYRTILNFCGIVVAILKMATGTHFSMSAINSGHHYLPTYQILIISDNVEFLWYCGGHFENGDR
jgi:hypothetical protein